MNIVNMSQYEAYDLLRYTPAPYIPPKANIMHFMSYNFLNDPSHPLSFSINLHQRIA